LLEDVKVKDNFKSPNHPTDFLFCPAQPHSNTAPGQQPENSMRLSFLLLPAMMLHLPADSAAQKQLPDAAIVPTFAGPSSAVHIQVLRK
jgi:hypothetical protein